MSYLRNLFKKTSPLVNKSNSKSKSFTPISFSSVNLSQSRPSQSRSSRRRSSRRRSSHRRNSIPLLKRAKSDDTINLKTNLSSKIKRSTLKRYYSNPSSKIKRSTLKRSYSNPSSKKTRSLSNNSYEIVNNNNNNNENIHLNENVKRVNTWRNNFNEKICKGIMDPTTLENNMKMYNINQGGINPTDFKIFNYCNEDIKMSKKLDSVNASTITESTLNVLKNTLNLNISFYDPPTEKIINTQVYSNNNKYGNYDSDMLYSYDNNDPDKFLKSISSLDNNHIIVSHSNFMTKFYKTIPKQMKMFDFQDKFQNLDIIQLIFDKNKLIAVCVRQYFYKYKINDTIEKHLQILYNDKNRDIHNVFIMRHCVGCHNIYDKKTQKISQAMKQMVRGDQQGYLSHAMCITETVKEMLEQRNNLLSLFKRYGGLETYTFGSSIIFRAIVTSGLLYNVLKNNVNRHLI